MKQAISTTEKLVKFVNQRPGLDFANYGDTKAYRSESREITADKHDFFELLSLAQRRVKNFDAVLTNQLQQTTGRLTMNAEGHLQYCTGQYFPTEYRPAANRILRDIIFASYRDEKDENGQPVYATGEAIRKAIKRNLSRRVAKTISIN